MSEAPQTAQHLYLGKHMGALILRACSLSAAIVDRWLALHGRMLCHAGRRVEGGCPHGDHALTRPHFSYCQCSYYGDLSQRSHAASPATTTASPALPVPFTATPVPASALCRDALSGLPAYVLDWLFFIEGEELLEEMLAEVGGTSALGNDSGAAVDASREVSRGGGSFVAAASTATAAAAAASATVGTRAVAPAGPCWHRVMLVPEDFAAALLHRPRSSPDGSGVGAVPSAAAGDSSARLQQPPDGGGLTSAKPVRSPGSSTAVSPLVAPLNSARGSSRGDTSSGLSLRRKSGPDSEHALQRPSEGGGVEPEDASNKSLPRRRASVLSIGRRDSADVLRAAAGEVQGVGVRSGV